VKTRTHRRVTVPNRCFVNHSGVIERHANPWNPQSPLDSVVSRRRLSRRMVAYDEQGAKPIPHVIALAARALA
ncbi:MAG TPA: hypothetical protein VMU78_01510, partial [Methylocella sp.]|nr:hypothetical protein [Methylocella sp.]